MMTSTDQLTPVCRTTDKSLNAMNAALSIVAESVNDDIEKRLGSSQLAAAVDKKVMAKLRNHAFENVDDIGEALVAYVDEKIKSLTELRDGPVKLLMEKGFEIKNFAQLTSEIAELVAQRTSIDESWPWSTLPMPPVDEEMLKESKAAFARGEGIPIQDLIRELGGTIDR